MRRALLALPVLTVLASLQAPAVAEPGRQVLLVLVRGLDYESALETPPVSEVADAGGIGLMTVRGDAENPAPAYVTLGAGAVPEGAPAGPVPFDEVGDGAAVHAEPYASAAGEDAEPGLLGSGVAGAGLSVGYLGAPGSDHLGLLVAMDRRGWIPRVGMLGTAEASALVDSADLVVLEGGPRRVEEVAAHASAPEVLVLVASPVATEGMRERGDQVPPLVAAAGRPEDLVGDGGPAGLTSATTRRPGVVSAIDVAPTVLDFLGLPVPGEMPGAPVEIEGRPPTALHERYVEYRRVVRPVGLAVLGLALAALLAGLAVVLSRRPVPRRLAGAVAVVGLGSVALQVALLPASVLPTYRPAVVAATLLGIAALLTFIALRRGAGDPVAPVAAVAAAGLALVAVDAALGWPSGLTPLLGGSAFDGVRFYGLGNSYAGVVLAGAVLLATRLTLWQGTAVLVGAALFAGLPFAGADLGGALTLSAVAGLWFALRRWGRIGWRGAALAVLGLGAGLAITVAGSRLLPPAGTHIARATGGIVTMFLDRLALNLETTASTPAVWLALAGIPAWLAVAWRRPAPFRPSLEADPSWRDGVVVLALGGIIGYVVNDTYGMAAVAFIYLSVAMVYPALWMRWMHG